MLTATRLHELFTYNPDTGVFRRRVAQSNFQKVGEKAGSKRNGYIVLVVDGSEYYGHRLAWLYMTGAWPARGIDHDNRNTADNRWRNLRAADQQQNSANSGLSKNNTSGFKGVALVAKSGRWRAYISVGRKQMHLGVFDTKEDAHAAYMVAATRHFGEFACSGD